MKTFTSYIKAFFIIYIGIFGVSIQLYINVNYDSEISDIYFPTSSYHVAILLN